MFQAFHDKTRDRLLVHVDHVVVDLDVQGVRVSRETLPDTLVAALFAVRVVEAIRADFDALVARGSSDQVVQPC